MAYSNDRKMIKQIRKAAKALNIAATWASSKQPINMSTDFVYELYILFLLIVDASAKYDVKYIPGTANKKHKFPRNPAQKAGRPKFEVYNKNTSNLLCQICSGTKIKDIVNMERAPDISFQTCNASDSPTFHDVELIWDGKYRKNAQDRITHHEISEFARWIDLLELKNSNKPNLNLSNYRQMLANCLITNGKESTEPNAERVRLDLKEVPNFFPEKNFAVIP